MTPYEPALHMRWWVWHPVYVVVRCIMAFRFRFRLRVEEPVPRGPVLLACKHVGAWDIPIGTYVTRRVLARRKPYFQMGSFIGYPVFGRLIPAMQACGGFSVMRPKEVLRLRKDPAYDRERIRRMMDDVNGVAEATRRAVLERGGVLVVFPEGTRDATQVLPVRSTHEIESALAVAASAAPDRVPMIVPATFSYGPKRLLWRRVDVYVGAAIPASGSAASVAARVEDALRAAWRPPGPGGCVQ